MRAKNAKNREFRRCDEWKKGIRQKVISIEQKKEIYIRFKDGESLRLLAQEYQIPHQSIYTFISKFRKLGTFEIKKRGPRNKTPIKEIERLRLENRILKKYQAFLKAQQETK